MNGIAWPPAPGSPGPFGPAVPPGPPPGETRSTHSDGAWHRMHPLTPLFRGGLVLVIVAGIIISNLRERIIDFFVRRTVPGAPEFGDQGDPVGFLLRHNLILLALLAVLVVVLVLIGVFWLIWRFHAFRITDDDVEVRQGVLFRSQRRAPLDRVQGVNLTRPMLARLLGMAKLDVVGAGADSNVKLEYLSTATAEAVRADILRLASGRRLAAAGARAPVRSSGSRVDAAASVVTDAVNGIVLGAERPVAAAESVVHIPVVRLLLSRLLGRTVVILILLAVAMVVVALSQTMWWVLFTVIPMFLGLGTYLLRSTAKVLRYAVAPTPDGVRITYGLFTTITETLPPGRIHAVEVYQPLLWRAAGWWAVRVNRLSGKRTDSHEGDQFAELLPVGGPDDVRRVLQLLMPEFADDAWAQVLAPGIRRPRAGDPYTNTPRRAWMLRPLSWRRNGFLLTNGALLLRRGVVWRSLGIFPLARLQSVGLRQGPLDRVLGVAALQAHVITGQISGELGAVDRDAAVEIMSRTERAAVTAGAADHTHRWAGATSAGRRADVGHHAEGER